MDFSFNWNPRKSTREIKNMMTDSEEDTKKYHKRWEGRSKIAKGLRKEYKNRVPQWIIDLILSPHNSLEISSSDVVFIRIDRNFLENDDFKKYASDIYRINFTMDTILKEIKDHDFELDDNSIRYIRSLLRGGDFINIYLYSDSKSNELMNSINDKVEQLKSSDISNNEAKKEEFIKLITVVGKIVSTTINLHNQIHNSIKICSKQFYKMIASSYMGSKWVGDKAKKHIIDKLHEKE